MAKYEDSDGLINVVFLVGVFVVLYVASQFVTAWIGDGK